MRVIWLIPLFISMGAGCERSPNFKAKERSGAQGALATPDGTPWVWQSKENGFKVTVPSESWKLKRNPNILALFDCRKPMLGALVIWARPVETDSDFQAAVAAGVHMKEPGASNIKEQTGVNPHGHQYWIYFADLMDGTHPRVFGASVTRIDGKAVLLGFEAPCLEKTASGRAQEAKRHRALAEIFLASVR